MFKRGIIYPSSISLPQAAVFVSSRNAPPLGRAFLDESEIIGLINAIYFFFTSHSVLGIVTESQSSEAINTTQ